MGYIKNASPAIFLKHVQKFEKHFCTFLPLLELCRFISLQVTVNGLFLLTVR